MKFSSLRFPSAMVVVLLMSAAKVSAHPLLRRPDVRAMRGRGALTHRSLTEASVGSGRAAGHRLVDLTNTQEVLTGAHLGLQPGQRRPARFTQRTLARSRRAEADQRLRSLWGDASRAETEASEAAQNGDYSRAAALRVVNRGRIAMLRG